MRARPELSRPGARPVPAPAAPSGRCRPRCPLPYSGSRLFSPPLGFGPLWASTHLRDPSLCALVPAALGASRLRAPMSQGSPPHPPGYAALTASLTSPGRPVLVLSLGSPPTTRLGNPHLHLWSLEARFPPWPSAHLLGGPSSHCREAGSGGAEGSCKGCPAPRPEQTRPPLLRMAAPASVMDGDGHSQPERGWGRSARTCPGEGRGRPRGT